jgi:hypothetical protein
VAADEGGGKRSQDSDVEREKTIEFLQSPLSRFCDIAAMSLLARSHSAFCAFSSGGPYHPSECCFTYITHAIPHHRISSFYETSGECPKPGVV